MFEFSISIIMESIETVISFIQNEYFLNGVFITMLAFVVLCHRFPRLIAKHQSNPYTIQIYWNFGSKSFDFQLLNYEIYHVSSITRWCHHLTIALEAFLWSVLIRWTVGFTISTLILAILIFQSLSFGDLKFGTIMTSLWISFAFISELILLWTTSDSIFSTFKLLIFYSVLIRTLSHVLELVPPLVNGDVDKFSNEIALWFAFSDPWGATKALFLGDLSEMASGLPGRLFPVVVYLMMSHFGYQSTHLRSISQTGELSSQILKSGWSSYDLTADLFSWALSQPTSIKVIPPLA